MISFENYRNGGSKSTVLYILLGLASAFVAYYAYAYMTGFDAWTGKPVHAGHAAADPAAEAKAPFAGDKEPQAPGYDNGDWDYLHSAQVGVDGVEGRDPSNNVQQYESYIGPGGKIMYAPKTMHTPQDYLSDEEYDFIVDRHTVGYSKSRLDWLTTPSYLRDGDMWFGTVWPNDNKAPLSNMRGACVNADDIVHHGIFRSNGKFGDHPTCDDAGY